MVSAYPVSFGGSPYLYAWALGSVTALSILMMTVCGWMARDIWRDRFSVHPKTALTAFRVILMLASATSVIRNLPEAMFLFLWNELEAPDFELILAFKRMADGLAIGPGALWTFLLFLAYPSIAHALKTNAAFSPMDNWSGLHRLVRPLLAIFVIFLIAMLVAFSKLYLGVPPQ